MKAMYSVHLLILLWKNIKTIHVSTPTCKFTEAKNVEGVSLTEEFKII